MLLIVIYLHLVSTLFMTGLIWFVQVVHYPMFKDVGTDVFSDYENKHQRLTGYVVGPAMLSEASTAVYLLYMNPIQVSSEFLWAGVVLAAINWFVTGFFSMPMHEKLAGGFENFAYFKLVNTNWLRTIAWSARGFIACIILHEFESGI